MAAVNTSSPIYYTIDGSDPRDATSAGISVRPSSLFYSLPFLCLILCSLSSFNENIRRLLTK